MKTFRIECSKEPGEIPVWVAKVTGSGSHRFTNLTEENVIIDALMRIDAGSNVTVKVNSNYCSQRLRRLESDRKNRPAEFEKLELDDAWSKLAQAVSRHNTVKVDYTRERGTER